QAVRLEPKASNYMLRAEAREAAGDLDRALDDYNEAARLDPKNVAAWTSLGNVWRKKHDADKAIAAYDKAVAADQNYPASYRLLAEAYAEKGDRKRAMAEINRALKFAWDVDFLKLRGALKLDDGDIAGAQRDAEAILKSEPENAG